MYVYYPHEVTEDGMNLKGLKAASEIIEDGNNEE